MMQGHPIDRVQGSGIVIIFVQFESVHIWK